MSTCAAGTLGCRCDSNSSCASGNLCSNDVCILSKPCVYGDLGCPCTPEADTCIKGKYQCSPVSKRCIVLERSVCDEKNGQLGCWCREYGVCDEGLECDETKNCVRSSDPCTSGDVGCACKEDGSCTNADLRCAIFGDDSVCVLNDGSTGTTNVGDTTNVDGTLGSSIVSTASSITAITFVTTFIVAILAQF